MPDQFDACCAKLTANGHSQDHACRACSAAFWQEHGMTPGVALQRGYNPAGDIADSAGLVAMELAAQGDEEAVFVASGPLREVAAEVCLSEYGVSPDGESLLRECEVLIPGTFNGYPFSEAELRDYAANYNPGDPPPVIKDHRLDDADNSHGYVRAMRYDEDNKQLMALSEFLGAHAVERVKDRRWKKLSGRFVVSKNPANRVMTELSVTLRPAYTGSRIGPKKLEDRTMPKNEAKLSQEATAAPPAPAPVVPVPPPADDAPPAPAAVALAQPEKSDRELALEEREANLAKREEEMELAAQKRRASEDDKDWQLLLAQGHTVPHLKDSELGFMATLSEEQKGDYITLRQSMGKAEFGRKSLPAPLNPPQGEQTDPADAAQQILLQSAREAAGLTTTNGQAAK